MLTLAIASAGATEPVEFSWNLTVGQQSVYREQARVWVQVGTDAPFSEEHQRTRSVTVDHAEDGRAQVRISDPGSTSTWLLDADGSWFLAQHTGQDALLDAVSQQAPGIGALTLPKGPIEVGHTWTLPFAVAVAPTGGPRVTLQGQARWRFDGWQEVGAFRCPILTEHLDFAGQSIVAHRTLGIAGQRHTKVCWDLDRGEVLWQQTGAHIALADPQHTVRMRLEGYAGRIDTAE